MKTIKEYWVAIKVIVGIFLMETGSRLIGDGTWEWKNKDIHHDK